MKPDGGIVLVSMPFGHVFSPSIGLALLKSELAAQGMSATVQYFCIRFAERIGRTFYYGLSSESWPSLEDLAGEWVFSRALFGPRADDGNYVDEILRRRLIWPARDSTRPASPGLIERILQARGQVDAFLQWCLEEVRRSRPKLVGFTSMFQQHVASLALARLIKQSLPETFIVFGGANCEDVMGAETVRQFPFVDAAVSGEADLVFPELARRVLDGEPVDGLPGVRTRAGVEAEFASGRFSVAPMVRALDALPYPDYRDYFEQFTASRFAAHWQPSIYLETSRGCWWGQRMHCTFCGLNRETMPFRSKSGRRALDELDHMAARHPGCRIEMTDSILDMGYFKDLVPQLAARSSSHSLFYEVKSNLKKEQLTMLRDAGIRSIQPGIESFSDPVLKLMRKGVSALQNIQLLKWCKELGVQPSWSLLWGFPGEPAEEYHRMATLVPLLVHLPPPVSYGMIRLDRFSPNFEDAERLGLDGVGPLPSYRYIYPLGGDALANLAYFFTFRYREPRDVGAYVGRLAKALGDWQNVWPRCDLFSVASGEHLLVWDLRLASQTPLTRLSGIDRLLYEACDSACDLRRLAEVLESRADESMSPEAIRQRLQPLLDGGLLLTDGSRYLALAVALGEYSPPAPAVERLYEVARTLGKKVRGGWVVSPDTMGRALGPGVRSSSAGRSRRRRAAHDRGSRLTVSQFFVDERGDVVIGQVASRRAV